MNTTIVRPPPLIASVNTRAKMETWKIFKEIFPEITFKLKTSKTRETMHQKKDEEVSKIWNKLKEGKAIL